MIDFNKPSAEKDGFARPEQLPTRPDEARAWQAANKTYWEKHSMRYDWDADIGYPEFSDEFYREIDRRFLSATWRAMPWDEVPFEQWLDVNRLRDEDVLEIGVGNGTHAEIIAQRSKSYTGIDLTAYASTSTSRRMALRSIQADIRQMDAEHLEFPDASFDMVWSWGVIHHSANTDKILDEIHRVLRPGGRAVIMVYYRSWWSYYFAAILMGIFKGYFFKGMSIHQITQRKTDGAIARYYSRASWTKLLGSRFRISRFATQGNVGDLLPIPGGRLKSLLLRMCSPHMAAFFLDKCRMGSFLITSIERK